MQAYARFLLVDSVAPQYDAFQAGFHQVGAMLVPLRAPLQLPHVRFHLFELVKLHTCGARAASFACGTPSEASQEPSAINVLAACVQVSDGPAMSLFFPEELELLVCGGDIRSSCP